MGFEPLRPADLDEDALGLYRAVLESPRGATPELRAKLTNPDGSLRGPVGVLLRTPRPGRAVERLGAALRFDGLLPPPLRELVTLVVAHETGCLREWRVHAALGVITGLAAEAIDQIGAGISPSFADEHQRTVFDAAIEVCREGRLGERNLRRLAGQLTEAQVVELVLLVGYYTLVAALTESFVSD